VDPPALVENARPNVHVHDPQKLGGVVVAKNGEPPANAFVMSALAIFAVTVVWGLVIGGTISAAIALAGEDNYSTTPTDANGFRVTGQTINDTPCTSWPSSSQTTVVSNHGTGGNWTKLNSASCTQSSTYADDDYFSIQIPSSSMPDPANHTLARVNIEFVSNNNYNNQMTGKHTMTVSLSVNGTEVMKYNEVESSTFKEDSSGDKHYYYVADLSLDGVQELQYRNEANSCYPDCVFELNFTNYESEVTVSKAPWRSTSSSQQVLVNVQTFTTDVDTGNFALAVMPWVIFLVNMAIVVASTPLWNPVAGWMGTRGGGF